MGRIAIDDEGHPAQRNVLIQDGVLTDYMWDFLRARKEGRPQSGNGRRESYQHLPMVRMTNTFVLNGAEDPADIIRATENGVYVAHLGGGSVNTATGDFVFGMTEAYLIENGEITEPLREGNLIGNGPQVLHDIDLLGNDFAMGSPGTCGKDGQGVPVGDGQPTLRVKSHDHRRNGSLSMATRRPARARPAASWSRRRPGEQIEAYVSRAAATPRSASTKVRSSSCSRRSPRASAFVSSKSGRTGFAYAGVAR